jgi:outer membrane receptor protein involved in Fe transport
MTGGGPVPPGSLLNHFNGPATGPTTCTYGGNTKYILYYNNHKKTSALGVFSEATYPITDALWVTGGIRYDYNKVVNREFYYAHGHSYCMGIDSNSLFVNLGSDNVATGTTCHDAGDNGFASSGTSPIRRAWNMISPPQVFFTRPYRRGPRRAT